MGSPIVVIQSWLDHKDTWDYVVAGDTLVYEDGSTFYVVARVLEEPKHVTFSLRVVVAPEGMEDDLPFGTLMHISGDARERLDHGITLTKG